MVTEYEPDAAYLLHYWGTSYVELDAKIRRILQRKKWTADGATGGDHTADVGDDFDFTYVDYVGRKRLYYGMNICLELMDCRLHDFEFWEILKKFSNKILRNFE